MPPGSTRSQPDTVFPDLPAGLAYEHHQTTDPLWSIHIFKISRSEAQGRFTTTLARGTVFDLEPISQQIRHLPGPGHPLAAVNGDFFVIRPGPYQGDPRGLQLHNGELVSAPSGTAAFWIDSQSRPHMEVVTSRLQVVWPEGRETRLLLNQARTNGQAALFTPALGPSTRTTNGLELVLAPTASNRWLPLQIGAECQARVEQISPHPNTPIPTNRMVLSLAPDLAERLPAPKLGTILTLRTTSTPNLRGARTAIGGGPILVRKGEVRTWRAPQPRHPRTALGWSHTHYFLVVVDGRQPKLSVGMSFPELAGFMRALGCQEAMNLDGGGSSTFWLRGRTLNSPSDGRERPVANGLVWVQEN